MPPDKAICHRAVLAAALAHGTTTIEPWPQGDDCQRTLQLIQRLGVAVSRSGRGVRIEGRGADGLHAAQEELFCGESGTTLRLCAGVLAGQPFESCLTAGPGLRQRPMRRIVEPLTRLGARIDGRSAPSNPQEVVAPLRIRGQRPLTAIRYEMPVASAQVKSAILFAALVADGPTTVIERQRTRDHTERLLRRCGARLDGERHAVTLHPGALRAPGTLAIPGDFSSAAFFIVAAACLPTSRVVIEGVGLNPSRTALLRVLERMGASVSLEEAGDSWEPRGTLTVEAHPLRAVTLEADEVPGLIDELPILMVAATCAQGRTRLEGLRELRVKETDRVASMADGLQRLGAQVCVEPPDAVAIEGGALRGGVVDSHGDHRTAMSLAVAGLLAQDQTTIRGAECVAKSFPEFYDLLRSVSDSSTVKTVDKA